MTGKLTALLGSVTIAGLLAAGLLTTTTITVSAATATGAPGPARGIATTPAAAIKPAVLTDPAALMNPAGQLSPAGTGVRPNTALDGVSCTSRTQCMAVGSHGGRVAADYAPLAEQWNGSRWRVLRVPGPVRLPRTELIAVSCRSSRYCVAAGYHYDASGSGEAVLAELWNGHRWRIIQSGFPVANTASFLNDVSCSGPADCLAVGSYTNRSGTAHALAERWTGQRWRVQPVAGPRGARAAELDGISCSRGGCVAVGLSQDRQGRALALAVRWRGATWRLLNPRNVAGASLSVLQDVSCRSTSVCMAVGYSDTAAVRPLTERYSGGSWRLVADHSLADAALAGVSCTASRCVAVGSNGSQSLGETWTGGAWRVLRTPWAGGPPASTLNQVSCLAQRCIAVGDRYHPGWSTGNATLAEIWTGRGWRVLATGNP
jgi:hypothetical protein